MKKLLCTLLFWIALLPLWAQGPVEFRVRELTVHDGLSNGRINDIATDSLGYMWFATANGLTRYSGTNIKTYRIRVSENSSDPSVLQLVPYQGSLLALMQGGAVFGYDYPCDCWHRLLTAPGENFFSLAALRDSRLVIGTAQGFLVYDPSTDQLSEKLHTGLRYIRRIVQRADRLLVSSSNGLHQFIEQRDGSWDPQRTLLQGYDILDFEHDTRGGLWVGTENQGLFHYQNTKTSAVQFTDRRQVSVRDIEFDQNGNLLLAVDRLGYFRLNAFGQLEARISHDPDNPQSLSQNSVNTIFVDRTNTTWLGVGEIGLNILYTGQGAFQNIYHERYADNTIENDIVRAIHEDDEGVLWFGTESGLSRLTPDGQWTNFDQQLDQLPVLSIATYQDRLVVGTYGRGLLTFSPQAGRAERFAESNPVPRVFATYVDGQHLWVGGLDGPIALLRGDSVADTFRSGQVKTFAKRSEDQMLAGTVEGVYQLNQATGQGELLSLDLHPVGNVYALSYDMETDQVWIGNDNGLLRYDFTKDEFREWPLLSEAAGAVYSIVQQEGALWLATEKGLFKYMADKDRYRRYGAADGVLIEEFGFGARALLRDRRIGFGGPQGAVIFDPRQITPDTDQPRLFFSDILVNGSPLAGSAAKNVNFMDQLELGYDENNLEFDVDYIKYHGSKDYRLHWQLQGHDDTLQVAINQAEITYQDLDPGTYRLVASIVNADGLQSAESLTLAIHISQPLWFTWWAVLLYGVAAVLLVYVAVTVYRVRQKRRISEEKVKFFIDVAHDIRTPVSLIRLATDQLLQNQRVEESAAIINRYTSNLNEYVTELLDFQKSERKKLTILASEYDLMEQLRNALADFQPMADQQSLTMDLQGPESLPIWGDAVQMGRVFNNLISNAIKYNHDKGTVSVKVAETENEVHVAVTDSGLGIPKSQMDKLFTRFHRADNAVMNKVRGTGIGLLLSKRIVELHRGTISVVSEEHQGSTFTVHLQRGKDHLQPGQIKVANTEQHIARLTASGVEGKATVLVIEDNKDILAIITEALSQDHFVLTAEDGKQGLLLAFDEKPDLVISDVMLPGKNGKELCHIIKNDSRLGRTPVIMVTALSGADDQLAGLEVGADFYLEKPFDIEVLKAAVKNLLKRRQLDHEISQTSEAKHDTESPEESLLSSVVDIITENLTNPQFSIDQLCDEVGLSRSNLFRKLKSIAGLSPSDLMLDIKLNRAQQLLKQSAHVRIEDVAYQSGFNDPRYFSTLFKKHFKKTPSEFQAFHHKA